MGVLRFVFYNNNVKKNPTKNTKILIRKAGDLIILVFFFVELKKYLFHGVQPTFRGKHTLSTFRHKKTQFLYAKPIKAVTKLIFKPIS